MPGLRPSSGTKLLAAALATTVGLGMAATALGSVLPGNPSPLLIGLLLGALITNYGPVRDRPLGAAAAAIGGPLLRVGIVLLGARGSLDVVAAVGAPALAVVALTMASVFVLVAVLARMMRVEPTLAVLLAVGTAVCGNSAIAAAAPLIRARSPEVGLAIACVTLFGTAALIAYPLIGGVLSMNSLVFGLWAGAGIHDTSQVVATGFAFSPDAGEVATIVKLGRNTLMLPILVGIALAFRGDQPPLAATRASAVLVGGYVGLVAINSAGLLPEGIRHAAVSASGWALTLAMVAVGLGLRLGEIRTLGGPAVALGLGAALAGGCVAFATASALAG